MPYFEVNNPDNLKTELIDGSNPDFNFILKLLEKIKPKKNKPKRAKYSNEELYLISSDKEILANEVIELISEDLEIVTEEYGNDGFEIQCFFSLQNPFVDMASFSCQLKNSNGGGLMYDIVRIYLYRNEYYLSKP